jgi:bifunctional DNA-binding transcriptional regulator/antitoxin component of YhaV-PrlF toxin-antitoxin module
MVTALREESQITLPKSLVEKLGISVGDSFEISEKEGVINLTLVSGGNSSIWPKEFLELQGSIDDETFVEPKDISFSEREAF